MESWSGIEIILGYIGVAAFALFLLDRSHRGAFAKLSAVYDKELEHQATLIDLLKMQIDSNRARDARID